MEVIALAYLTAVGLAVGSFLNLAIDRIPRGASLVSPPSHCDNCQRRLGPQDLVPLLSYLWLRGKCRYCRAPIPLRNMGIELLTGGLFFLAVYRFDLTPLAGVIIAYGCLFIAISGIDLEHTIIPDKLVLPAAVLAFAAAHYGPVGEGRELGDTFLRVIEGGGLGVGVMLLIYLASIAVYRSTAGFRMGDVKLGGLMGLVLGFPEVSVSFDFAFVFGGIFAVVLLLLKLRSRRDAIPYGPFWATGAVALLLVGKDLGWYLDLIR